MTLLQEKRPLWFDAPATTRLDPDVPADPPPPTGPAPEAKEWRWVPDPTDAGPPAGPWARYERLFRIYAWARTIGF